VSRFESAVPRSLVWATDIDVLPLDRVVERGSGFLLIRSPGNPAHYWGNLLLFDREPRAGDAVRWEALFEDVFGDEPLVRHRTFGWDLTDGTCGAAHEEFSSRGYEIEESIGLVAHASQLVRHSRENREVAVEALDPTIGADEARWNAVVELQVAGREDGHGEEEYRSFTRARLADRRALFRAGRGAWFAAIEPDTGEVVASCGVVVTADRGRFQVVDTAPTHRRRGICSRLVVEAASRARDDYGAERFVIAGDADYHAVGLYESLGFERAERVFGVCAWPRTDPSPLEPPS
jgi:ribosomal protein S18 acetylase RimI-like enzyme